VYRKGKISEFGLRLNLTESIKYALSLLVLASPLIINAAHMPEFRAYYPIWRTNTLWEAIYFEVVVLSLLMFNNEFFFRGFFLFSLEKEIGRKAIIIHAFPYTLAHLGKPWLEIPYSFLAGLIFGYIALKTKSILPTFLTHWIGAATFDFLCY
jgi:membrane protease YdiL (CAAX protease family)